MRGTNPDSSNCKVLYISAQRPVSQIQYCTYITVQTFYTPILFSLLNFSVKSTIAIPRPGLTYAFAKYRYWHMAFHLLACLSYCWLSIMMFPNSLQLLCCLNVCFRMSFYYLKENEVLTNVQKCQSGKWSLKMQKGGNGDKMSMPQGRGEGGTCQSLKCRLKCGGTWTNKASL